MSERTSLEAHVDLCELRYRQLDDRMNRVEERIDKISTDVKELKQTNDKQFGEIKSMLTQAKDDKFKVMVTVAGTVICSLLGLLGYIVVHMK
jgi:chromosome segregation ATPase